MSIQVAAVDEGGMDPLWNIFSYGTMIFLFLIQNYISNHHIVKVRSFASWILLIEHNSPGNNKETFYSFPLITIFIEEMYSELSIPFHMKIWRLHIIYEYVIWIYPMSLWLVGKHIFPLKHIGFQMRVNCVDNFKYSTHILCGRAMWIT